MSTDKNKQTKSNQQKNELLSESFINIKNIAPKKDKNIKKEKKDS